MKNSVLWQDVVSVANLRAAAITLALAIVLASGVAATTAVAQTYSESTLYSYTGVKGDGGLPSGGALALDAAGNIYGITGYGGDLKCQGYQSPGCGIVFKLDTKGHETLLHTFKDGKDGADPFAGIVMDKAGNLYGTTGFGGNLNCNLAEDVAGCGTIFEINQKSGKETVLHSFKGTDGMLPAWTQGGRLTIDAAGNIYGTTVFGGDLSCADFAPGYGCGVVFKIDKTTGKETTLYAFKGVVHKDGAFAESGVVLDAAGNIYGATTNGGLYGSGTVFEIATNGEKKTLYTFTGGGSEGYNPSGIAIDSKGNLYVTVEAGGNLGFGSILEVPKTGKATNLWSFTGGSDGAYPYSSVTIDSKGKLYGTTPQGGTAGMGTVFTLEKSGLTVLYNFTGQADGSTPVTSVYLDKAGNIYGQTYTGGDLSCNLYAQEAIGCGTVYKLTPQ